MTTKERELHQEASLILIQNSIADKREELHTVQSELENELAYGIDNETGVLTPYSQQQIVKLQRQERLITKQLNELEMQLGFFKPTPNIPWRDEKDEMEVDTVRTLDQYLLEQQEYENLKEIAAARERAESLNKDHEIDR